MVKQIKENIAHKNKQKLSVDSEYKGYIPRIKQLYYDDIHGKLMKKFTYKNIFEVPKLEKIVLNSGVGEAAKNSKVIDTVVRDIGLISGQKPVITKVSRAIAGFKIREGMPIGVKVTLRRNRMYEFLDRLLSIALPRVRDFRGLSPKSFDGYGNYALGIKEHIIFPEINYDAVDQIRGFDIVVCTTAKTNGECKALLEMLNFPFRKN